VITDEIIDVRAAGPGDAVHAQSIADEIRREVEDGAVGMALRTPELIRAKMASGDAIIALRGGHWVGFCYLSLWEGGRFVSTSGLIVPRLFRGLGTARLLKHASLELAHRRYPEAHLFGLTMSPAVARLNLEIGLREVPYAEITRDPGFWQGCETCPFHAELVANLGVTCRCRAFVR
jgi:hypothetical protein